MPNNVLEYILSLKDSFSGTLKKAEGAADNFGATVKNVGGASAGAVNLISTGFTGMAGNVKAGFELLKGDYSQLGDLLGALPGPVGIVGKAIGDSLGSAMTETVAYTEAMRKAATTTGASVSFVSQFTEAADDQFVSQEAVIASLGRFSKGLGGVTDMEGGFNASGKGVAQVLEDMGVKATDASGKVRPMEELIPALADKFREMGPGVKTTALAIQLFGKQGAEMLPVLLQGSEAMKASMQAAKDMGLAIDQDAVAAVKRLKVAQDSLGDSFTAIERKISLAVIPALADEIEYLNSLSSWTALYDYQQKYSALEQLKQDADKIASAEAASAAQVAALSQTATAAQNSSEQNKALAATAKVLEEQTQANIPTWKEYNDETQRNIELSNQDAAAVQKNADASDALAKRNDALKESILRVSGAIDDNFGKMTKLEQAQIAYKLATGQTTVAQFESDMATKAITKSYVDGNMTLAEYLKTAKDIGTSGAGAFLAMKAAGVESNAGMLGVVKQMRDVENAAGVGGKSFLTFADSLNVTTYATKVAAPAIADVGAAEANLTKTQILNSEAVSAAKKAYDDHKLSLDGYVAVKTSAADKEQAAKEALDKVTKATKDAKDATYTYTSKITDAGKAADTSKDKTGAYSESVYRLKSSLDVIPTGKTTTLNATAGPSWNEIFGPNGLTSGLKDGSVTKTLMGKMDGSLKAAKDYYDSINNGTAEVKVTTSVTVNYNPTCFAAGTRVSTPDGGQAIEALRVGDRVWAYDHELRQNVESVVTQTFEHHNIKTLALEMSNRTVIYTTPEHPFFTRGEYIPAGDLAIGDYVQLLDGMHALVLWISPGRVASVYNIEVETYHNYFADLALVHNNKALMAQGGIQPVGNNMTFQNNIGAGMSAAQTARMVQQAQASATRQALLRASIGG